MRKILKFAGLALILAGCSESPASTDTDAVPYERPGWMAAQAQADEELIIRQSSCLTEQGYVFDVRNDGQFQPSEGTDFRSFADALRECTAEALGDNDGWRPGPDDLRLLYERQLDVVSCLENEGHLVEDIPSVHAYVDSSGKWSPYGSLAIDGEALAELKRRCPDPGPASL